MRQHHLHPSTSDVPVIYRRALGLDIAYADSAVGGLGLARIQIQKCVMILYHYDGWLVMSISNILYIMICNINTQYYSNILYILYNLALQEQEQQ